MAVIEGFILAGGESRRMGTDKAKLVIEGQSFVERIAGEMKSIAPKITVVGSKSEFGEEQFTKVEDVYPRWGALGGVHAALASSSCDWALIVACDFPLVTAELFCHLVDLREGFEAVAPIQRDGIPQPLCGLYRIEPCLNHAERLIRSGERKPIALLQSVRTRWVSFDELSHLKGAAGFFDNINTPEDFARVVEKRIQSEEVTG